MRCWGEVKSLRAQSVGEVSAYWSCVQFSGYVEMKVSQTYNKSKSWMKSDQRDIVWFVSSACYLRRHWPECFGRVKRTLRNSLAQ